MNKRGCLKMHLNYKISLNMKSFLVGYTNCKRKNRTRLIPLNYYATLKPDVLITFDL